jgi:DNA-binding MarR family transcriptional regulator
MSVRETPKTPRESPHQYVLDEQIGFMLRQVTQRHAAIFAAGIGEGVTMTQWAALAKLHETGPLSQNFLGRLTVMDAATIKGVIDRLGERGLTDTNADPNDARRRVVSLTETGAALVERCLPAAQRITEETVAPLTTEERATLVGLLLRMR